MQEHEIRDLVTQVRTGRLPRRAFVQHMLAVGLSAPMAGMILAHNGIAFAQTPFAYKPTKAGGGGALKILQWQGPTMLNPHLSTGPDGHCKFPHPWPPQIPPGRTPGL